MLAPVKYDLRDKEAVYYQVELSAENDHRCSIIPDAPLCTSVLGEADGKRAAGNLLLKKILLVEEEDDGGFGEPFVVADGVKKLHALMHSVLKRIKTGHGS